MVVRGFLAVALAALAFGACSKKSSPAAPAAEEDGGSDDADDGDDDESSGGSGGSSREDAETYTTSAMPQTLALTLPASVMGDGSSLRLQEEGGGEGEGGGGESFDEGSTSSSQGFQQLSNTLQTTKVQITQIVTEMVKFDALYKAALATCDDDTDCTVEADAVCGEFSASQAKLIVESIGEGALSESEVSTVDDLIGSEYCAPAAHIRTGVDDDVDGLSTLVTLTFDDNNSMAFAWNDDKSKVRVGYSYRMDFSSFDGTVDAKVEEEMALADGDVISDGTATYLYDGELKSFRAQLVYASSYEMGGSTTTDNYESRFTIRESGTYETDHGVLIVGSDGGSGSYGAWSLTYEGILSDNGGYLESAYGWETISVTSPVFSRTPDADVGYSLFPADTTAATADLAMAVGSFWGDGSDSPMVYVYGVAPSSPANLVVLATEYGESGVTLSAPSPALSITSWTVSTSTSNFYYREEWDKDGELLAWCAKSSPTGSCEGGEGDFGDYATEFEDAGDVSAEIAGFTLALTGAPGSPYPELYFSAEDLTSSSYTFGDQAFWDVVRGYASYDAEMAAYVPVYWGEESALGDMMVFSATMNDSGEWVVTRETGASIGAE